MSVRFPDVTAILVDALAVLAGGAGHAGVETPADLASVLPFVRVRRGGGGSDLVNDYSLIDVEVFADRYAVGEPLAEEIRQVLADWRSVSPALDRVECDAAPREMPWGDGSVRRWGATYQVVARRVTVP